MGPLIIFCHISSCHLFIFCVLSTVSQGAPMTLNKSKSKSILRLQLAVKQCGVALCSSFSVVQRLASCLPVGWCSCGCSAAPTHLWWACGAVLSPFLQHKPEREHNVTSSRLHAHSPEKLYSYTQKLTQSQVCYSM